jgi:endonuclease YncB( thermonuclease family)
MKIRLHGVYCPELKQDYGQRAKQFTSSQIFGKTVTVKSSKKDRYGRTIGTVYLANGQILNELLLQNGLAWHSKKYDSNTY